MAAIDPNIPYWPTTLVPQQVELAAEAPIVYGPRPGIGAPRGVMNDAGLWRLRLVDIELFGSRVLALRAILLRIVATSGALYMPMWDWRRRPAGVTPVSPKGDVAAAAAADLTLFKLAPPVGVALAVGQIVGIGDRAYGVYGVTNNGDGTFDLSVWPPLRDAVAIGDDVDLYNPVVRMRADLDQAKQTLGSLLHTIGGSVTLDFVEDNWT